MKRFLSVLLLAPLVMPLPARADIVLVTAQVGWSCGTGTGGFEPGCSPDLEQGQLTMTYDSAAIDTDAAPGQGTFVNPLYSFRMTVEQTARPDLVFTLAGSSRLGFGSDGFGSKLTLHVDVVDESGALGRGSFILDVVSPDDLLDHDQMPQVPFWQFARGIGGSGYGVQETDWAPGFAATAVTEPISIACVVTGLCLLRLGRHRRGFGLRVPGE